MDIKKGDTAPALDIELTSRATARAAKEPVDLTGATIRVIGKRGSTTVFTDTSPTVADNIVTHEWDADETATTGEMLVEVEVTYANGKIQTFPPTGGVRVRVRPQLG